MAWLLLTIAIVAEVIATSFLEASDGFTRLLPSLAVVVGYAAAIAGMGLIVAGVVVLDLFSKAAAH